MSVLHGANRLLRLTVWAVWRQFLDWSGAWWFALTLAGWQLIGPLIGLFVWSSVFPTEPFVTAYFLALMAIQLGTASYENHTFANSVYDGTVSHELLKPQPVVLRPLAENIAIRIWLLLIGAPVVLLTGVVLSVGYAPRAVLLALPAVLLAALVRFLYTWTLALSAFWTHRVHAVCGFGDVLIFLLGGSAAPVTFLPEPLRSIAEAAPFRAMLGFPGEIATGSVDGVGTLLGYGYQLVWAAVFTCTSLAVWRAGVRRFTAVGA